MQANEPQFFIVRAAKPYVGRHHARESQSDVRLALIRAKTKQEAITRAREVFPRRAGWFLFVRPRVKEENTTL